MSDVLLNVFTASRAWPLTSALTDGDSNMTLVMYFVWAFWKSALALLAVLPRSVQAVRLYSTNDCRPSYPEYTTYPITQHCTNMPMMTSQTNPLPCFLVNGSRSGITSSP